LFAKAGSGNEIMLVGWGRTLPPLEHFLLGLARHGCRELAERHRYDRVAYTDAKGPFVERPGAAAEGAGRGRRRYGCLDGARDARIRRC